MKIITNSKNLPAAIEMAEALVNMGKEFVQLMRLRFPFLHNPELQLGLEAYARSLGTTLDEATQRYGRITPELVRHCLERGGYMGSKLAASCARSSGGDQSREQWIAEQRRIRGRPNAD